MASSFKPAVGIFTTLFILGSLLVLLGYSLEILPGMSAVTMIIWYVISAFTLLCFHLAILMGVVGASAQNSAAPKIAAGCFGTVSILGILLGVLGYEPFIIPSSILSFMTQNMWYGLGVFVCSSFLSAIGLGVFSLRLKSNSAPATAVTELAPLDDEAPPAETAVDVTEEAHSDEPPPSDDDTQGDSKSEASRPPARPDAKTQENCFFGIPLPFCSEEPADSKM